MSRARSVFEDRRTPPSSFCLDLDWLSRYWACPGASGGLAPRVYHHTAPVHSFYALREALAMLTEETLEESWRRHRLCADMLHEGEYYYLANKFRALIFPL